ncbi:MAG: exosortase system-associated protein, TIGR04073 family [Myxococcota bacterium]
MTGISETRRPASARSLLLRSLVLLLAFSLTPLPALAEPEQSAARKFGRGSAGIVLGILEIPGNMVQMSREDGYAKGLTLGFAMGLGMFVVREIVGVYEFLTCPFPLPADFEPVLDPEFPWDYFEDDR